MNILYVYAHPNPNSFNGLLKESALNLLKTSHHTMQVSDLYAAKFNAQASSENDFNFSTSFQALPYFSLQEEAYKRDELAIDIVNEINKVQWADHLIFQFPFWWFSAPAILKGWLDRVLVKGFAYAAGKMFNDGLLKNKSATLVITTQSPESAYQVDGLHGATIDSFLLPIHHTLRFVGIKPFTPFVAFNAFNMDKERSEKIVASYLTSLKSMINA